ncbi:hypothetical protein DFH07DRAFT_764600 [Mycena maculata]|uniref:Uncharacterized protein n=1 Tax=Mycena maculata TaxID=230809 RepID=A0AAD7KBY8_9AGAR|nr:hypothetical protein DFH07DRAFT_764600 [Mycena maculata]
MSIFNMRDPPSSEMDCADRSGPGSWISSTALGVPGVAGLPLDTSPQNQIKTRLSLRSASLVKDIAPRVGQTMSHPSGEKRTSGTQEARSGECCSDCQLTGRVKLEAESHLTVPSLGAYALRASASGFAGLERSTSNGDRTERANRGASSSRGLLSVLPVSSRLTKFKIEGASEDPAECAKRWHEFPPRAPLPPITVSGQGFEEYGREARRYRGANEESSEASRKAES